MSPEMAAASAALRSAGLNVYSVPYGLAVSSGMFVRSDGDLAGGYVSGPDAAGCFRVVDDGLTFAHLHGEAETTACAFGEMMGFSVDHTEFEFVRDGVSLDGLPRAAIEMLVMLFRIAEMPQ